MTNQHTVHTVKIIPCNEENDTIIDRTMLKGILCSNKEYIIVKLSAEWCSPCKKVKPIVEDCLINLDKINKPNRVALYDVDVDSCFDLFAFYKSKKVISGIPAVMVYYPVEDRDIDFYYLPTTQVNGFNEEQLRNVFIDISSRLNNENNVLNP